MVLSKPAPKGTMQLQALMEVCEAIAPSMRGEWHQTSSCFPNSGVKEGKVAETESYRLDIKTSSQNGGDRRKHRLFLSEGFCR